MIALRLLLAAMLLLNVVYTADVIANHGWNLIPEFFGAIAARTWAGQFNVDFSCFLVLSGLYLAWRHRFTPAGLALGVLGYLGGTPVLGTYLLIASRRATSVPELILGPPRSA